MCGVPRPAGVVVENMLRLLPVCLLVFTAFLRADPVQVWPTPPPADGLSAAESPAAPPEIAGFQNRVDRARQGPIDLLFDGDSITDFWQSTGKAVWREHYGQVKAYDFGVSGERTENLLWRLDHGQLEGLHPKLVVLLIGTNNLGRDPDEIPDGIKLIVDTYRKDCPEAHVLLLGIFPRSPLPTDPVRALIKKINGAISKFDDGQHVTYLDLGTKFLHADGTLTSDIMPDFIHPSEKGYRIWADAIQPIVDRYCPKGNEPAVVYHEPTLQWPFPLHPPAGAETSTFPVPTAGWFWRYQGNIDKLKKPTDLLFDGDEAMEGWQDSGRGYPVWKERYAPLHAANIGIGGDQVQNVLWRTQQGELDGQNPKLVVLMIGANNNGQDPAAVARGIKLVLNEYETRCPQIHILLIGIFPRDLSPLSASRSWVTRVNQILSTYDDGKRVTFLDIGAKFLLPDGTMNADLMPDYVHPTAKAYAIWADAMQPVINQYEPKP